MEDEQNYPAIDVFVFGMLVCSLFKAPEFLEYLPKRINSYRYQQVMQLLRSSCWPPKMAAIPDVLGSSFKRAGIKVLTRGQRFTTESGV
jgi:hypothetical protein